MLPVKKLKRRLAEKFYGPTGESIELLEQYCTGKLLDKKTVPFRIEVARE
jgi:hypothetical protein